MARWLPIRRVVTFERMVKSMYDYFVSEGADPGVADWNSHWTMERLFRAGIGGLSPEMANPEIWKALQSTAGQIATASSTGGDTLKMQDVLSTIAIAEQRQQQATLWRLLPQKEAISDVIEWTKLTALGAARTRYGGFISRTTATGGLNATDPTLARATLPTAWWGRRTQVFRTALALQALGWDVDPARRNAEQVAKRSKLEELILLANIGSYWGENGINTNEADGLIRQIRAVHTTAKPTRINLAGQPITPETFPQVRRQVMDRGYYGKSVFLWSTKAYEDMEKQLLPFARSRFGESIQLGMMTKEHVTKLWDRENTNLMRIYEDVHLNTPDVDDAFAADPDPPTGAYTVTSAAVAGTNNPWGGRLGAATYDYSVAFVGVNGRTAAVVNDATVTTDGSQAARITVSAIPTGAVEAHIYRRTGTTGARKFLVRADVADTTLYDDNGEFTPGAHTAVLLPFNEDEDGWGDTVFRTFFPLTWINLPPDVMAEQGAWLLAGTPQCRVPEFGVVVENIGDLA